MKKWIVVVVLGLVALAGVQTRAEGNSCRDWSSSDAFNYSSVTAAKTFFYQDDRSTKSKAFLLKGDVVAVRNIKTDFACAVYVNAKGVRTIGWLEVKALKDTKLSQDVLGNWETESGDASLSISKSGSSYRIKGNAIFPTSGNTGKVSGALRLSNGQWIYESERCVLNMLFLNNQLLVQDNLLCGGLNVTFSGTYRRKK